MALLQADLVQELERPLPPGPAVPARAAVEAERLEAGTDALAGIEEAVRVLEDGLEIPGPPATRIRPEVGVSSPRSMRATVGDCTAQPLLGEDTAWVARPSPPLPPQAAGSRTSAIVIAVGACRRLQVLALPRSRDSRGAHLPPAPSRCPHPLRVILAEQSPGPEAVCRMVQARPLASHL